MWVEKAPIQFGGAAGKVASDRLGLPVEDARLLVAAGTATGFGAAYNTPFAAVLFVLEVVTGVVVLDAILPALVATVIAVTITRAFVGAGPIFGLRAFHSESPLELFAFAGLGIVAALGAQGFMRTLAFGEALFQRPSMKLPWRPAHGGLVAGRLDGHPAAQRLDQGRRRLDPEVGGEEGLLDLLPGLVVQMAPGEQGEQALAERGA